MTITARRRLAASKWSFVPVWLFEPSLVLLHYLWSKSYATANQRDYSVSIASVLKTLLKRKHWEMNKKLRRREVASHDLFWLSVLILESKPNFQVDFIDLSKLLHPLQQYHYSSASSWSSRTWESNPESGSVHLMVATGTGIANGFGGLNGSKLSPLIYAIASCLDANAEILWPLVEMFLPDL